MDYISLGKKVRINRQKLNLTQESLAERLEISESFLGHIERGSRKLSLETLMKIAQELNVSLDYLLLDSVDPEPNIFLSHLSSILYKKDKGQVQTFINTIKVLVDNLDKWAD